VVRDVERYSDVDYRVPFMPDIATFGLTK